MKDKVIKRGINIRITTSIPVPDHCRPEVGAEYLADKVTSKVHGYKYRIRVGDETVCVLPRECEVVKE